MNNKKCKGRIRPHLTRDDRSLKRTAEKIGKSHSTVSREIRPRRIDSDKGAVGRVRNRRIHRRECDRRRLCANMPDCTRKCSACIASYTFHVPKRAYDDRSVIPEGEIWHKTNISYIFL